MKNKTFSAIFSCCLAVVLLLTAPVSADHAADTVNDAQNIIDGICAWNLEKSGAASVQDWIDGELTQNAGVTSEWYIFGLSRYGDYDFSAYETALLAHLRENTIASASSRLKNALVLQMIGSTDGYVGETLENSIGQQGIMSWVYGLHLMNNGAVSGTYTAADVVQTLLSLQCEDGGWSLTGGNGDVDVTAMTVQALAFHTEDDAVQTAVDRAVEFLAGKQLENGGYASYGVPNPESTAQVLVALTALGIDCAADERFVKDGNTLFDGITQFRLDDGSFSHKAGDASNHTATVQSFYAMVAYLRMTEGKSQMYIRDVEEDAETVEMPEEAVTETTAETAVPETTENASETTETVSETAEIPETIPDTLEIPEKTASKSPAGSYKPWAILAAVGIGAVICVILLLSGKRQPKNFIAVLLFCGIASVIILVTDFQSAESYYGGSAAEKENVIGNVTLAIRCDTAAEQSDAAHIPQDGVILPATEFALAEGESVYDILTEAAQSYQIQMENNGTSEMAYIVGIGNLYEFDFGDLSGWVYHVNGEAPSVGCGEYVLEDGDEIEWLYTCDLGEDVKK